MLPTPPETESRGSLLNLYKAPSPPLRHCLSSVGSNAHDEQIATTNQFWLILRLRLCRIKARKWFNIERDSAKCSGKPCIAGTRIRVWEIHVWLNRRGQSPEKIVAAYPSLADVHAALAYYFVHRQEIQQQAKEDEDVIARLKHAQGITKFDLLKRRLGIS